jgi:hypothetical protein
MWREAYLGPTLLHALVCPKITWEAGGREEGVFPRLSYNEAGNLIAPDAAPNEPDQGLN